MNFNVEDYEAFVVDLCCKQVSAVKFVHAWNNYCHDVDDFIDKPKEQTPEKLIRLLVSAKSIYCCQFFRLNEYALEPLITLVSNGYADSIAWEKSTEGWQRYYSDTLSAIGNEVLLKVAEICGGWDHMRVVSPMVRKFSYLCHHTEDGKKE
jgi:hypothetical protein